MLDLLLKIICALRELFNKSKIEFVLDVSLPKLLVIVETHPELWVNQLLSE